MTHEKPSAQEMQLLETLREWGGDDDCRLLIERRDGAWEISLAVVMADKKSSGRGVGATFDQAWDNTIRPGRKSIVGHVARRDCWRALAYLARM
jgi:hypothetical protein